MVMRSALIRRSSTSQLFRSRYCMRRCAAMPPVAAYIGWTTLETGYFNTVWRAPSVNSDQARSLSWNETPM